MWRVNKDWIERWNRVGSCWDRIAHVNAGSTVLAENLISMANFGSEAVDKVAQAVLEGNIPGPLDYLKRDNK